MGRWFTPRRSRPPSEQGRWVGHPCAEEPGHTPLASWVIGTRRRPTTRLDAQRIRQKESKTMSDNRYNTREYAFIVEALMSLIRRLNTCTLPVVMRDEVVSAMGEYLTRKVSDLVTRYPSGTVFIDAVFTTRCIDALRTWRSQRGEGARGERIIEVFDAATADTYADGRLPNPLDKNYAQLEAGLITRVGARKGRLVFRVKVLGEDTSVVAAEFGISRSRAAHLISEALRDLKDEGPDGMWVG